MKVLVTLSIPDAGINMLREAGLEVEVWEQIEPMTPKTLTQRCKQVQYLLCTAMDNIDATFLQDNSHLKIVSQFGAGYDNVDVSAAAHQGIIVGNTPEAMSDATADIAFMLMLTTSRKFCFMHKTIIQGDWGYFEPKAHLGQELKGKTLGVFGLGRIGFEMAKRCRAAYQMPIIYCNRTPNQEAEELLQAHRVDFDTLLESSDVLSVHCALTPETKEIFNQEAFKKMKSTSIFINTSRGPVHQEQDLIEALQRGEIWGAGLDVTNPEPMQPNNPLLSMENVCVIPHIGSATVEARDRMAMLAAQNILQFHRGEEVVKRVN